MIANKLDQNVSKLSLNQNVSKLSLDQNVSNFLLDQNVSNFFFKVTFYFFLFFQYRTCFRKNLNKVTSSIIE